MGPKDQSSGPGRQSRSSKVRNVVCEAVTDGRTFDAQVQYPPESLGLVVLSVLEHGFHHCPDYSLNSGEGERQ